jgi:exosortase K
MKRQLLQNSIFYVIALLIAFGLKYHYSQASSDDLTWILGPTARIVEQISKIHFEKEEGTGYINREHRIIIVPSCAGVNFFIIAFCMTVCSFIHYFKGVRVKFLWLWTSFVGTYLLTLATNALRIIIAIHVYHTEIYSDWLTQERLHRIEGIVVYFSFLCIFYVIIRKIIHYYVCGPSKGKRKIFLYAGFIPLFWYILINLVVPLLNVAYRGNTYRFIEHGSIVFAVCVAIVMIFLLIQIWYNRIVNKQQKGRKG